MTEQRKYEKGHIGGLFYIPSFNELILVYKEGPWVTVTLDDDVTANDAYMMASKIESVDSIFIDYVK